MKQRIVVQAIIQTEDRTLLLRRSQSRPGIVGKYELPGGTLDNDEQPDDGLRRHLRNDAGLNVGDIVLDDAMSLTNREENDIQHVFIVYRVDGVSLGTALHLGSSYDKFDWKMTSELQQSDLRDSALYLLKLHPPPTQQPENDLLRIQNVAIKSTKVPTIYSDGGSRGNPGPSACAFVLLDGQDQVIEQGEAYLGITTNNQAEYHGVRLGLEKALEMGFRRVQFRVDSMLVANQLRGMYKIKNRELWPINERIVELVKQFDSVVFTHIPREQNQLADALVNKCLDQHKADVS